MMWSPPGYTTRLPVRLEAWSSSVLLLSWVGLGGGPRAPGPIPPPPRVSLYHPQLGSYTLEIQEPVQHHLHHLGVLHRQQVAERRDHLLLDQVGHLVGAGHR